MSSPQQPSSSLEQRRAERELFFWTAFKVLRLVTAAAFTAAVVVYVAISTIEGGSPLRDLLLVVLGSGWP